MCAYEYISEDGYIQYTVTHFPNEWSCRVPSSSSSPSCLFPTLCPTVNQIEEATGLEGSQLPALRELDLHGNLLATTTGINIPHLEKLYVVSRMHRYCCVLEGVLKSGHVPLCDSCSWEYCAFGMKRMQRFLRVIPRVHKR